jgi:CDP-glucose 4,6-dehydratase
MNILVTGASGFLGSHLADRLTHGNSVYGLVHDRRLMGNVDWTPVRGDVTDYARMFALIVDLEIDQVYHCAAKAIVRNCRVDPIGCFNTNVMGTVCVLEATRQSERVKGVMCMESDKAYGAGVLPYTETQTLSPGSVYEASKACVRQVIQGFYQNYGVPVFGVRSANIYGPGDRQFSRLIPNTITRLNRGEKPQIVCGAELFLREYIYVVDAVNYVIALMAKQPWGESFNIGSGESMRVGQLIGVICELMGKSSEWEVVARPATFKEIPEQVLCLDKLLAWVGNEVSVTPLRDGLKRTIQWYMDNS